MLGTTVAVRCVLCFVSCFCFTVAQHVCDIVTCGIVAANDKILKYCRCRFIQQYIFKRHIYVLVLLSISTHTIGTTTLAPSNANKHSALAQLCAGHAAAGASIPGHLSDHLLPSSQQPAASTAGERAYYLSFATHIMSQFRFGTSHPMSTASEGTRV